MRRLTELSRSVAGKVALITGAASGIGRQTARLFADEGAHVAVTDRAHTDIAALVDEIGDAGGSAYGWEMDVTDDAQVRVTVEEVVGHFGALDILVNNAGIARFSPVDADDYDQPWQESLDVLLTGPVRVVRAALPHLRAVDGARIVNVASTEGLGATRFASPYTTAKHGVIGLTRSLALELGREGITVNCVCPGPVDTGMTRAIPPDQKALFAERRSAIGRYAAPEEVAHGILGFCLPAASYMTGAVLPVDGGLLIRNA